ncbi:uncharacterized protein B0H18DRAFT_1084714 [Fomitopsis serialis]|uniref:uncharacterized protein n=1 Tax=Fomitopsis serialis TaxID=139415 RepID=UPI00200866CB|nr:uncharacterized protein B0H18DRAFT_1084714 [Neoantrodia serialis]KAH9927643.1 hypothetical protein B0H18DRAFT_1084714 [Neoantrodia serialis]
MAPGRRNTTESATNPIQRPLRIVASGTLFLTHTLELPTHPLPNSVLRASTVIRSRGGAASTCLSILAQFAPVEALLVAPLGGNEDGRKLIRDLERERVSTRFCKVWEEAGVPSAWVLHADDTDSRTVVNNNPLPDITHEDFVSLLGPLLAPENYLYSPPLAPAHLTPNTANAAFKLDALQPRPSMSSMDGVRPAVTLPRTNTSSPAPFDWVHFEGRSVKTTLSNIMGLEGLAQERKWRNHCVFSVDVGRRAKQGVEALVPYADVVFLNKHYALAHSPQYAASPRAFLLSLTTLAAPHALLVAHWGEDGAALLSVPTREYFQSSGWVAADSSSPSAAAMPVHSRHTTAADDHENLDTTDVVEMLSVRTGSDFWAGQHTDSSSVFTAGMLSSSVGTSHAPQSPPPGASVPQSQFMHQRDRREGSADSDETQTGNATTGSAPDARRNEPFGAEIVDEVGAQDAFVAGMMYALSRRLLPGEPYTPSGASRGRDVGSDVREVGRWRLEECLRFATELAGRKARRRGWEGLAEEMARVGWFEP